MFAVCRRAAAARGNGAARARWPTVICVSQLSFFSAESVPPAIADLTGVLAAPGQAVLVGGAQGHAARLSVVVDRLWRAEALAEMIEDAGLEPEIARTDENTPLVRTAVDARLVGIAVEWTRGAVKTVPPQWLPGPRELRAWTLAAGSPEADDRYLLGLDPHAPDTHSHARVGDDAGRDRADADRHQGVASGAADQRPSTAISPGRERGGTSGGSRGVVPVAADLTVRGRSRPEGPVCVGTPGVRNCLLPERGAWCACDPAGQQEKVER